MKKTPILASICLCAAAAFGASEVSADAPPAIPLWSSAAPLAHGDTEEDIPALTPFLLEGGAPRPCIIICPGGGYAKRTYHEGELYTKYFHKLGFSAFVLRYRIGTHGYRHPVPLTDVSRAVRHVRAHAADYGIDPNRLGIIGSSAGGHLVSTLITHFDGGNPESPDPVERVSSRPDFAILMYPVITMDAAFTHAGSRAELLGENPSPELVDELSNEKRVRADTPPTFIVHAHTDKTVPIKNSLVFAEALAEKKVPFELHTYEMAGHAHGFGIGMRKWQPEKPFHPWTVECARWLAQMGFAPKKTP